MTDYNTIIINDDYYINFELLFDTLTITTPDDGCIVNFNDNHFLLNNPFSERLLNRGWSLKGIAKLQEYLSEEGLWDKRVKMDPKTGVIKRL